MKNIGFLFGCIAILAYALPNVSAEVYPERTVTIIVPFTPGDGTDVAARLAGKELAKMLKTNFAITNRLGAGGAIGVESALKSPKDGYTLLFTSNTPLTVRRVIDPATAEYLPSRDLVPLGLIARFASILAVRSDAPYKNIEELIRFAKKNPGQLRFGTPGSGSVGELNVAIVNAESGVNILTVPYKGSSPAVADLLGGHVDGAAVSLGSLSSHLKGEVVRGIVVSRKDPDFRDIPTLVESGYKSDILGLWVGFFAPSGIPANVVHILVSAIKQVADDREFRAALATQGMRGAYEAPETMSNELDQETKKIQGIVKKMSALK